MAGGGNAASSQRVQVPLITSQFRAGVGVVGVEPMAGLHTGAACAGLPSTLITPFPGPMAKGGRPSQRVTLCVDKKNKWQFLRQQQHLDAQSQSARSMRCSSNGMPPSNSSDCRSGPPKAHMAGGSEIVPSIFTAYPLPSKSHVFSPPAPHSGRTMTQRSPSPRRRMSVRRSAT